MRVIESPLALSRSTYHVSAMSHCTPGTVGFQFWGCETLSPAVERRDVRRCLPYFYAVQYYYFPDFWIPQSRSSKGWKPFRDTSTPMCDNSRKSKKQH